ncbi:hypothetical protein ACQX10_05465, partial [Corynebacterium diphtheriae]
FPASPLMVSVGWGSVLKNPDRLPRQAGGDYCSWGSVLKNPDRLPPYDIAIKDMLGFSSQKP